MIDPNENCTSRFNMKLPPSLKMRMDILKKKTKINYSYEIKKFLDKLVDDKENEITIKESIHSEPKEDIENVDSMLEPYMEKAKSILSDIDDPISPMRLGIMTQSNKNIGRQLLIKLGWKESDLKDMFGKSLFVPPKFSGFEVEETKS